MQTAQDRGAAKRPINFLFDIPIELTVEVGRRSMTMGELVEVMPGTVVELDRPAGDNLDIFANGKLVARGEAVLVGERYGIRVMEVVGEDPFKQTSEDNLIGD
ncbi:MAG: flagellar motor switch protein FliN [Deltaproteobacteria bacterium]|nr:flagellar motor switch protein FliN [Deltaproteobacteria bacterium]